MTRVDEFVFDSHAIFEVDGILLEWTVGPLALASGAGPEYNQYCYNDFCGNDVCVGVAEIGVSPGLPSNRLCLVNPLCGRNISCGPLAAC